LIFSGAPEARDQTSCRPFALPSSVRALADPQSSLPKLSECALRRTSSWTPPSSGTSKLPALQNYQNVLRRTSKLSECALRRTSYWTPPSSGTSKLPALQNTQKAHSKTLKSTQNVPFAELPAGPRHHPALQNFQHSINATPSLNYIKSNAIFPLMRCHP
jgi:hypothetical protein